MTLDTIKDQIVEEYVTARKAQVLDALDNDQDWVDVWGEMRADLLRGATATMVSATLASTAAEQLPKDQGHGFVLFHDTLVELAHAMAKTIDLGDQVWGEPS